MRAAGTIAGLFGKLPSHGDFINRGVPTPVEGAWTRWLDGCLGAAKAKLDEYWLPTYLSSPPWRFALDAGLIDGGPVVGVLASSVDKVGRAYPMAGFLSLGPSSMLRDLDGPNEHPFAEIETILLEAIDGAIDANLAAARLTGLAPAVAGLSEHGGDLLCSPEPFDGTVVILGGIASSIATMVRRAERQSDEPEHSAGWSCFWQNGWAGMPPAAVVSRGLPPAHAFLGFLDGQWTERGWSPPRTRAT
jgi:type VI secretion system protein ImpM